ncbi:Tat pathway signal sequence domain protein [Streptomyces boninensis]|uniref:Tat pathway signal sequence domain protein n=1 Tax=Streptomyces boninensis TaxID=2039455 RepID=UPI003B221402
MSQRTVDRRGVLKAAVGVAAAAGTVTLAGTAPAVAHGRGRHEKYPKVPGMVGDRKANEFWYQYDEMSYYTPTPELQAAVGAVVAPFGKFEEIWDSWLKLYQGRKYPYSFAELLAPNRDALKVISDAQREVFSRFYGRDPRGLVFAFQEYGQGTLYDPRRGEGQKVHMMNYTPPNPTHAYHRWHPFLRAFQIMDVDRHYWTQVHRLVGTAWELQSIAQPVTDRNDNPHLPRRQVRHVTNKWLRRPARHFDAAFAVFPYPADMGR